MWLIPWSMENEKEIMQYLKKNIHNNILIKLEEKKNESAAENKSRVTWKLMRGAPHLCSCQPALLPRTIHAWQLILDRPTMVLLLLLFQKPENPQSSDWDSQEQMINHHKNTRKWTSRTPTWWNFWPIRKILFLKKVRKILVTDKGEKNENAYYHQSGSVAWRMCYIHIYNTVNTHFRFFHLRDSLNSF